MLNLCDDGLLLKIKKKDLLIQNSKTCRNHKRMRNKRVPVVEHELGTLPGHLRYQPMLSRDRVVKSLVFSVVVLWTISCLPIDHLFSFNYFIVFHLSICGF